MANTEETTATATKVATGHDAVSYREAKELRQTAIEVVREPEDFEYIDKTTGEKIVRPSKRFVGVIVEKQSDGTTKKIVASVVIPEKGIGYLPASFATPQMATFTEEFDTERNRWFMRSISFVNAVKPIFAVSDKAAALAR